MDDNCAMLKNLATLVFESGIEILLPHQLPDEWIHTLLKLNDQQNSEDAILVLAFAVLALAEHRDTTKRITELKETTSIKNGIFSEGVFKTFQIDLPVSKMATVFGAINIYVTYLRLEMLRRDRVVKEVSELSLDTLFSTENGAVVTFYNPSKERQELEEYLDDLIIEQPTTSFQFH